MIARPPRCRTVPCMLDVITPTTAAHTRRPYFAPLVESMREIVETLPVRWSIFVSGPDCEQAHVPGFATVHRYPFKYLTPGEQRNALVGLLDDAEWVMNVDSDDLLYQEGVAALVDLVSGDFTTPAGDPRRWVMVNLDVVYPDADGIWHVPSPGERGPNPLTAHLDGPADIGILSTPNPPRSEPPIFFYSQSVISREVWLAEGGYPAWPMGADTMFVRRLATRYPGWYQAYPVGIYRRGLPDQMTAEVSPELRIFDGRRPYAEAAGDLWFT